jgi:hypothetical protein
MTVCKPLRFDAKVTAGHKSRCSESPILNNSIASSVKKGIDNEDLSKLLAFFNLLDRRSLYQNNTGAFHPPCWGVRQSKNGMDGQGLWHLALKKPPNATLVRSHIACLHLPPGASSRNSAHQIQPEPLQ